MKAYTLAAIILFPLFLLAEVPLEFKPSSYRVTRLERNRKAGILRLFPAKKLSLGGVYAQYIPKRAGECLLLEADVKCVPTGAFMQVVLMKNGKAFKRLRSEVNRKEKSHLKLAFDTEYADKVLLLLRAVFDEKPFAKVAEYSNVRFLTADEATAEKKVSLSVSPGYNVCHVAISNLSSETPNDFSARLKVRKKDGKNYVDVPEPVFDHVRREGRSSMIRLESGSDYELAFEFTDNGKKYSGVKHFSTLAEHVPVGKTIYVDSSKPFVIDKSGTPDAWIRYTSHDGKTLDFGKKYDNAVTIENAKYILLENMKIKGGKRNAVYIFNSEHIAIINCDISGFGELGEQMCGRSDRFNGKYFKNGKMLNNDSGVFVEYSDRIRVERCFVHDPTGRANGWFYCHPAGPNALFVRDTSRLAVRYNDFIGSSQRRWNDAVISAHNFIESGGSYREAEFSGNTFAFGNDDSVELDGGQINSCYIGNYVTDFLCGVSASPCLAGPSYIADNLFDDGGDEYGAISAAVKNNGSMIGRGRVNIFGNVVRGYWKFGINPFGGRPEEAAALETKAVLKCLFRNNVYELADGKAVNPAVYKNKLRIDDKNNHVVGISSVKSSAVHPVRPLKVSIDKQKLCFKESFPQSVTVFGTAGFKGKFRVMTTGGAPYRITPEIGNIVGAAKVVLTVTPDFDKIKHPQVAKTVFLIRFEDGLSIPVHVSCDATDRSDQIKELRENDAVCEIFRNGEKSELKFKLKKDGMYYLFCRITPDTATTVKVSVDGGTEKDCSYFIPSGVKNPWCNLGGRVWRGGVTYPLKLKAGEHKIVISGKANIISAAVTANPDAYRLVPNR